MGIPPDISGRVDREEGRGMKKSEGEIDQSKFCFAHISKNHSAGCGLFEVDDQGRAVVSLASITTILRLDHGCLCI